MNNSEIESLDEKSIAKNLEGYRKSLREDPTNIRIYESYLFSLLLNDRLDEAFKESQNFLQTTPDNPYPYWIMGNIYTHRKLFKDGEKYLQKALEVSPNFYPSFVDLGVNMLSQQRMEEGISQIQKSIAIRPQYWRSHYNLSMAYFHLHKNKEGYQEAKLAWRNHKSMRTFSYFITAYDTLSKSWSIWIASSIVALSYFIHTVYILPLLILAVIRLSLTGWYFIQTARKVQGYLVFITISIAILNYVANFQK